MKKVTVFLLFVAFAFAAKAQSLQPNNRYQQKRWFDSLRINHKQSAIAISPVPELVYNTPVALLPNEGKKIGMSGEDTIYQMKTDNMLLLKPNRNATYSPNATEGKLFMMPPAKKPK